MQMNRTEILERLKDILLLAKDNNTEIVNQCTENSKLVTDLGLTSVSMLYVVIATEEMFNIRFENVGMADFETVKNVVDYIEEKIR